MSQELGSLSPLRCQPTEFIVVFVVIATAVYDHGVVGVYRTHEEATDAASAQWRHSDGHHRFRVEEIVVGSGYDVFQRFLTKQTGTTQDEPRVEFIPEANRNRWDERA